MPVRAEKLRAVPPFFFLNIMKKLFLFLLSLLCVTQAFAGSQTFNITMTVGQTVHIDPYVDTKLNYLSDNSKYEITGTDPSGLGVLSESYEQVVGGSTYYHHYTFNITAFKTGNYVFTNKGYYYYKKSGLSMMDDYYVIYNITVVDIESITLPSSLTLQKGQQYTFAPVIYHPDAERTLTWNSTNPIVAEISNEGVVTTKQVGSAIITCTADNGVSAMCTITITPVTATDMVLNYDEYELELGKKVLLEATVLPETTENKNVTWTSSNESVAVVSSSGNVTGLGLGYASIVATTKDGSNIKANCLIHVVEPAVLAKSITLDWSATDIKVGQAAQLVATITPSNVSNTNILWTSSNPECVSVNDNGIINGLAEGTATITAATTDGTGLSAECVVNVLGLNAADYDNTIYTEDTYGCSGGSVIIPVKMKNKNAVTGFQFNIYLPDGFSVTKVERGERLKTKINDEYVYSFDSSTQPDGSTFVLCYSSQNVDITGNDGEVALVTIKIPEGIAQDDYTIALRNIELSKAGSSIITEEMTSKLTVGDYMPGDANGDGRISVADLTSIASYLMGNTPDGFIVSAADASGDGRISVADLTTIADQLMNAK